MDSLPRDITNEILQREFAPNSVTHIYKLVNKKCALGLDVDPKERFDRNMFYYYIKHNNLEGVRWFSQLMPPHGDDFAARLAIWNNCVIDIFDIILPSVNYYAEHYTDKDTYGFLLEVIFNNRIDVLQLMIKKYNQVNMWIFTEAIERCKPEVVSILIPHVFNYIVPVSVLRNLTVGKPPSDKLYDIIKILGDNRMLDNRGCIELITQIYRTGDEPGLIQLLLTYFNATITLNYREDRPETTKILFTNAVISIV